MADVITSKENPKIKRLTRLLASKKDRAESGLFVCEGVRLSLDACRSGVKIEQLFLSQSAGERYPDAAGELSRSAGETVDIADTLALRLGDTKSPQGVFAVCKGLDNRERIVTIRKDGNYLLLCSLQDPGNLGTILRTAEALGIDGVLLDQHCPELYSPKVLRASMGGVFRLPVAVVESMAETVARLRSEGVAVWAAALAEDAVPLGDGAFSGGVAVMIGNEGNGLSRELIGLCDRSVLIPMAGGAQSLGAAAAATILLWEMMRQKRRG